MPLHPRVTRVEIRERYQVLLHFTDGSTGVVDLAPWIVGKRGVFAALNDPTFFRLVTVDSEAGTLVWPNGADLDPDVLYETAHTVSATGSSPHGKA